MLGLGAEGLVGTPYDLARRLKVVRTTLDEGNYCPNACETMVAPDGNQSRDDQNFATTIGKT